MGRPKKVKTEKPVLKTEKAKYPPELENQLKLIKKEHGVGSIMTLADAVGLDIESISTGSLSLDKALGIGGIPRGRTIEIFGLEASGKTTLCMELIKRVQQIGEFAAFIDSEQTFDKVYATAMGLDLTKLLFSQPNSGEETLSIVEKLIDSSKVALIVVDSVAALVTKAELEGAIGASHIGLQARLMGQALRKLTAKVHKTNTCLVFTNQLREKINTFGFGEKYVTPGGRALKFYASVRIDLRRIKNIKKGKDKNLGIITKATIKKNKVAPPFEEGHLYILFGKGLSKLLDTIFTSIKLGILKKNGSWITYQDKNIGQGVEQTIKVLKQNENLLNEIRGKTIERIKNGN